MKTRARLDGVRRVCATAATPDELVASLSEEFRRLIPHDGAIWMALDPATMLATAPSRVESLDERFLPTFWHLEFFEHDTGHFVDLARTGGATAMRLELGEQLGRSPRYRDFMRPQGYGDELRAVFRSASTCRGAVGLYRETSRAAFTADDLAFVTAAGPLIAEALRMHVRALAPVLVRPPEPGLVTVDRCGRVLSANEEAMAWLRVLWPQGAPPSAEESGSCNVYELRGAECGVATPLHALVARARAVAEGRDQGPAMLRLRDWQGRWSLLHASAVKGPGFRDGEAVGVIIQAATRSDIAPLLIDSYSLTPREREVLGGLARGQSTADIAAALFMSPHTVRDHIKTVFEKVGVSSRGELVARLFGESQTGTFGSPPGSVTS